MGLFRPFSSSTEDNRQYSDPTPPNPNPERFTIVGSYTSGRYVALEVQYHGCTTFNGHKILVFKDENWTDLLTSTYIDPHFLENEKPSPIARFIPTEEGRAMAQDFIRIMNAQD